MVKMVDDELKIEVKELIKAASMTANIKPVNPVAFNGRCSKLFRKLISNLDKQIPGGNKLITSSAYAMFVHPAWLPQTFVHTSGSAQATLSV